MQIDDIMMRQDISTYETAFAEHIDLDGKCKMLMREIKSRGEKIHSLGSVIGPKHMEFVHSINDEVAQLATMVARKKLADYLNRAVKNRRKLE